MSPHRQSRIGKQKKWKLEEIRQGFESFRAAYDRYPTSKEIDDFPHLPTARSIQRRFGGLVEVRNMLGLDKEDHDLRSGEHSSQRAFAINKRAHRIEEEVFTYLVEYFGREFVHREYFFTDDRRVRADFFVFDSEKGFCIDVFHANSRHNVTGCINSKLNKYTNEYMRQYPVIFLHMNKDISQEELDDIVSKKKRKLLKEQYLMNWDTFTSFCCKRTPLQVSEQNAL